MGRDEVARYSGPRIHHEERTMSPVAPPVASAEPRVVSAAALQALSPPAATLPLVTLSPRAEARVAAQAEGFVQSLLAAEPGSEVFRRRRDAALNLGVAEAAFATRLGRMLLLRCCRGIVGSAAFRVKRELHEALQALDAARTPPQEPARISGHTALPSPSGRGVWGEGRDATWAVRSTSGDRKVVAPPQDPTSTRQEDAATRLLRLNAATLRIDAAVRELERAREDVADHASAIEETKLELRAAMRRLRAAGGFAQRLQRRMREEIGRCRVHDVQRAQALAAEVLVHAGRRVAALRAQEAAVADGYLLLDPLRHTAGDLAASIERLRAAATATLAAALRVARVAGPRLLARTDEAGAVRGDLCVVGGRATGSRLPGDLDPAHSLAASIDVTLAAIDALDDFRAAAIARMLERDDLLQVFVDGGTGVRHPPRPGE